MNEFLPPGCCFRSNHTKQELPIAKMVPSDVKDILEKIGLPYDEGDEIILPPEIMKQLNK